MKAPQPRPKSGLRRGSTFPFPPEKPLPFVLAGEERTALLAGGENEFAVHISPSVGYNIRLREYRTQVKSGGAGGSFFDVRF